MAVKDYVYPKCPDCASTLLKSDKIYRCPSCSKEFHVPKSQLKLPNTAPVMWGNVTREEAVKQRMTEVRKIIDQLYPMKANYYATHEKNYSEEVYFGIELLNKAIGRLELLETRLQELLWKWKDETMDR